MIATGQHIPTAIILVSIVGWLVLMAGKGLGRD